MRRPNCAICDRVAIAIDRRWRRLTHGWPRSNCVFFAVALYFRRKQCGNFRMIDYRRARNSILPHFIYVERRAGRDRRVHYVPAAGGDSESAPIFSGLVMWGDRAPNRHLAATIAELRAWARGIGDDRSPFCVGTKYGALAFFRDQIDAARGNHRLEALLMDRIEQARADLEARRAAAQNQTFSDQTKKETPCQA